MWVEGAPRHGVVEPHGDGHPSQEAQQKESFDGCVSLMRGLGSELDESSEYTRSSGHSVPTHLQLGMSRISPLSFSLAPIF